MQNANLAADSRGWAGDCLLKDQKCRRNLSLCDKGSKLGCVIGNPKSLCRREDDDKDLSCREYRHLRWRRRPYSPIDRIKPHPSIGRGRTDPRPNSRRRRATICPRSAVIITIWRGKRGGRWERQTQPQNASRARPTLGIQKTITTLYPQLPLRRTVAIPSKLQS